MTGVVKVLALAVGVLALPGVAGAQAPAGATFTGGGVSAGEGPGGSSEIGVRVSADGTKVSVRGTATFTCADAPGRFFEKNYDGTLPVAPDGTFGGALQRGRQGITGKPWPATIAGTVNAGGATGAVTVTRPKGGWSATCTKTTPFSAVASPQLAGAPAAPAPAGAVLLGGTSQRTGGPFGMNLRVGADGRSVVRSIFTMRLGCRKVSKPEETNFGPGFPVAADGSFSKTERFTFRDGRKRERATVTLRGRFVAGGATGTVRWQTRYASGARCDTGTVRWSAAASG